MEKKKGFTLIEVLVVVIILGVLATIVIPKIASSTGDAKDAKCVANWAMLIRALELYGANNDGSYPANQIDFDSDILNEATYFPHGAPTCPYTTAYTFVETAGEETVTAHSH